MTDFSTTLPRVYSRPNLVAQALHLIAVARSRRALANLSDEALADVGITRKEAVQEATRPIWDAPSRWRR